METLRYLFKSYVSYLVCCGFLIDVSNYMNYFDSGEVAQVQDKVLRFHKEQKWQEVLELSKVESDITRRLLWVWPSESNLQLIKQVIQDFRLGGLISIGCGSGLFEWLLEKYSGFPVIGYEVNEAWWMSKYSNPQFIKLNFPHLPPTPDILSPNYGLLFCYFNNGRAFREYISCYEGNFVIIIGPGLGSGRHTDPEPLVRILGQTSGFCIEVRKYGILQIL